MIKTVAKIFAILFFIISSKAFSQAVRSTTFDDRPACEEVHGVWRQFGNGCVDECSSKFDKFSICPQVVAYGCDCGRNRCWNGDTCVMKKDYKKIFDEEWAKDKKILDAAKARRRMEAKVNEESILNNLATKAADVSNQGLNSNLQNNGSQNAPTPQPPIQNQSSLQPIQSPTSSVIDPSQNSQQPIQPAQPADASLIPPFFQQQEKAKQDAANAAQPKDASKVPENTNQAPVTPISTLPGLPVIPLPQ